MTSLRARLLAGLSLGLLVAALAGAGLLYRTALDEANVVFDEQLRDTALTLRAESFDPDFASAVDPDFSPADRDADLVVQVFSFDGVRVYQSHPHVQLPGVTALGYSTVQTDEGPWRVYGVQLPQHVIQVAQPLAVREARAARLALRLLGAVALLLPLLATAVWLIVGRTLKPLSDLATHLHSQPETRLEPLPLARLPDEARPLVQSFNGLLTRLASLLERERAFLADAAHELRTPLTALHLQVQALDTAPPSERAAALAAVRSGVERANRLIEQMLSLARQDQPAAASPEPVAFDDLVREEVARLLPLADARGIDLGVTDSAPITLRGQREALAALVRNLVDNALRYGSRGSRVDVALRAEPAAAVLVVRDQGPGIAAADRGRVFDRFYRAAGAATGGSGLGLAIVKAVADAQGARIELTEGENGRGLVVMVSFPTS